MIGYVWRFIVGSFCRHEWEIEAKIHMHDERSDLPSAFAYHLRCRKCGDMKQRKFSND